MNKDTQSWSNSNLTEMEELVQKVQQLETENAALHVELQEQCALNGTGSEREYVLRGRVDRLKRENAELDEKLESKRKTIKSLNEELEKLRVISIENERLAIENKHLREDRPQSELDAAHLAAENAMLNANFARYISATQDTEKQNERLASMVRELQDENAALRSLLRIAITDHVDPYDLPEGDHYIARVKAALGEGQP
jgi:chromosome segregation ATPase